MLGSHRELEFVRVPPQHRQGEEPSARHRVGPWYPVTPVDLVPTLAGGDKGELMPQLDAFSNAVVDIENVVSVPPPGVAAGTNLPQLHTF